MIRPTDFFVPGISLVFIVVVLWLLIANSHLVPNKGRSSPCVFLPDAYGNDKSLSGFFGLFGHFEQFLMPECGQGYVKVAG